MPVGQECVVTKPQAFNNDNHFDIRCFWPPFYILSPLQHAVKLAGLLSLKSVIIRNSSTVSMTQRTWEQSVKCDIRKYGMQRVKPLDTDKWRSCCGSSRPTRVSMEKMTL